MVPISVPRKLRSDRKVSETRLTVLSDQDIVLNALTISVRLAQSFLSPTGLILPCKILNP